jgi:ADP-ribose pyrophosphatase
MADKIIQTVRLYEGRVVTLDKRIIELPNKRITSREVVLHQAAAGIIAITNNHEVLLVSQYRSAIQKEILEIPAGLVEKNEDPIVAAARELREETGMEARSMKPISTIYSSPGFTTEEIHLFLATDLFYHPLEAEDTPFITVTKLPISRIDEFIQEMKTIDGKTLAGLLIAKNYQN